MPENLKDICFLQCECSLFECFEHTLTVLCGKKRRNEMVLCVESETIRAMRAYCICNSTHIYLSSGCMHI